ncbi:MAG: GNAT family N-acetyltransferase [Bacteroidetes bacterium]|nr:GNAT family N-acetyltransferase [Bacteroidota bacterium]
MTLSLTTDRLTIERITPGDSAFVLELVNTDGWIQFIGDRNVRSIADAEQYIQKIQNNPAYTYLVFKLKETGSPVGVVTVIKRDYLEYPDIGFAMLPEYSGMGYSYEASKKVLGELERSGNHPRIQAITMKTNVRSIALLQKLGLQFEKEIYENNETLLLFTIDFLQAQ